MKEHTTVLTTKRRIPIDVESIFKLMELGDYLYPYTIRAVCLLEVADRLADGPLHIDQLAKATGSHPDSLRKTLRYLATRDVFTETEPDTFGLTPIAELLRADHPYSAREVFLSPVVCTRAMEGLDHAIRTGEPAWDAVHGRPMWDYLADHPDDSQRFDKVMSGVTAMELMAILRAVDWTRFGTVVDIGGGNGGFLSSLLGRVRGARGILFDLPGVVTGAPEVLGAAGVSDRCEVIGGSFLIDPIPAGGNAYVLKRILYSWSEEQVISILSRIREAMAPDGRVFILEAGSVDAESPALARRMDMLIFTLNGNGARSVEQQRQLLGAAGLELVSVTPTPMFPIIEARAA